MLRRRPPSIEDDADEEQGDDDAPGIRSPNKREQKRQANTTIIGSVVPHSALFCCGASMTSEWKNKHSATYCLSLGN